MTFVIALVFAFAITVSFAGIFWSLKDATPRILFIIDQRFHPVAPPVRKIRYGAMASAKVINDDAQLEMVTARPLNEIIGARGIQPYVRLPVKHSRAAAVRVLSPTVCALPSAKRIDPEAVRLRA